MPKMPEQKTPSLQELNTLFESLMSKSSNPTSMKILIAFGMGDTRMIKKLLETNPGLITAPIDANRGTVLHYAAGKGNIEIINWLIPRVSKEFFNRVDSDGDTALNVAAFKGYDNIVEILLEQMSFKAINTVGRLGNSPLHMAVANQHDKVVVKLLNKYPNMANVTNDNGLTALFHAVARGHKVIVEMLLENMTKDAIGIKNSNNCTALHMAASEGHSDIVDLLIAKMSPESIIAVNVIGQRASDCAYVTIGGLTAKGHSTDKIDYVKIRECKNILTILKQAEAEAALRNFIGQTSSNSEREEHKGNHNKTQESKKDGEVLPTEEIASEKIAPVIHFTEIVALEEESSCLGESNPDQTNS